MKQNKELDQILQQALSPDEEPDYRLNQNILRRAKENENMDRKQKRRVPAVIMVTAFTLLIGSVTAVAAWRYMTPDKVAEVMEDEGLMQAFQSKNAIIVNESQFCGDLKITLLGMVSGKDLSSYVEEANQNTDETSEIKKEKTYIVTAIEKVNAVQETDDAKQEEVNMNVIVSPLVKGLKPWEYNIYTMGGDCMAISENGIEYRITESDNVEIFADRVLYLAVTDGVPSAESYQYDESTGEITRNESYQGVNALFSLPIDESKADREAAEKYLQAMKEEEHTSDDGVEEEAVEGNELIERASKWSKEELEKNAELLNELTQVLTPDAQGYVTTAAYKLGNGELEVGEGRYMAESILQDKAIGETVTLGVMDGDEGEVYIETFTLNVDGTVTLKVYYYNEAE